MKWLLLGSGVLVALFAVMAIIGALLPRGHIATRRATYAKTPAEMYAIVRDFTAAASWRPDVKKVELLPPRDGQVMFRETGSNGAIAFVVREDRPNEKLVTEIADPNLPFGGTWTFEFAPAGNGGALRITERGEVKNVLFRFLSRLVFSPTKSMEAYLHALGKKFGEQTIVEP